MIRNNPKLEQKDIFGLTQALSSVERIELEIIFIIYQKMLSVRMRNWNTYFYKEIRLNL